jgi:dTDP-glucose 4,6-dehydratase
MVQRVVVAGGASFLGSHLCERLLAQGRDVVALDDLLTASAANTAHLIPEERCRFVTCDVTDDVHLPGEVDLVLHFASPASPIDYLRLFIETLKVGSIGTLHALGLAWKKKARFLAESTSETYGDPQVHPQPGTYWGHVNPVGPRGVYDEAKRYAEALTRAYRTHHGVDTTVVRIVDTFGPRMRPNDGRAIPTFIRQALAGEPLTVAGDGSQTRSVCYVDDMVEGVLRLGFSDPPGLVDIGNPTEVSVPDLARLVQDVTGSRSSIQFIPRPQDDPHLRQPDITLAREGLGWKPEVDIAAGLARSVEWFRDQVAVRAS